MRPWALISYTEACTLLIYLRPSFSHEDESENIRHDMTLSVHDSVSVGLRQINWGHNMGFESYL